MRNRKHGLLTSQIFNGKSKYPKEAVCPFSNESGAYSLMGMSEQTE